MTVETPAQLTRHLGATRVISVHLPGQGPEVIPSNMFQVVNRCFQILEDRAEDNWRKHSDLVITPSVRSVQWDGFDSGPDLIRAGQAAALEALPRIQLWIDADREAKASRIETRLLERSEAQPARGTAVNEPAAPPPCVSAKLRTRISVTPPPPKPRVPMQTRSRNSI